IGHYVRTRTALQRSGIALSAIAALLIPVDFYTLYVNFDISPEATPTFWLVTSLVCLGAYLLTTFAIHSTFFGYLVGMAAGSTALAVVELGHQHLGLPTDWRSSALTLTAVLLLALATRFRQQGQTPVTGRPFYLLAEPFRFLALLTVGVLMPLTFGLRYLQRESYDALHYAVTLNWWVGGLLFGWGAVHYRSRSLGMLAAIALPVSVFLAQAALFERFSLASAWHAVGWSLLIPLYLISARRLLARTDDPVLYGHGQTALRWGSGLFLVATLWTLSNLAGGPPVILSYTLLAANAVLATVLWQKPRLLYGASLLSFLAMTFLMLEIGLEYGQLGVGWASLALAHIALAISLGPRFPALALPVVFSGYALAALALLPSLFPYHGLRLTYALGNWLGLAAWGARLAYLGQPGFLVRTVEGEEKAPALFHWLTALALPIWVWLLFANRGPLTGALPLTLAALAWAMVLLGYRLALLRANGAYRKPWYYTGIALSLVAALAASLLVPDGKILPLVLVATSLLHGVAAFVGANPFLLLLGSPMFASGYVLLLYRLGLSPNPLNFAVALLVAGYLSIGLWTERQRAPRYTQEFLSPLYHCSHLILFILQFTLVGQLLGQQGSRNVWLWTGASEGLLAIAYGFFAWGSYQRRWAHLSVWLAAASAGLVGVAFSSGTGSAAAKGALLAWALILGERGLFRLRKEPRLTRRWQAGSRLLHALYQQPLLVTGWTVSVGIIGMALFRNVLLMGGRVPQLWAIVALLIIAALYATAAWLYQRPRLVWLAALLLFAPWTILTNLGWLLFPAPTWSTLAIGWLFLAWLLYGTSRALRQRVPAAYLAPVRSVALGLLPFSLLWAFSD
ncbi:MAG: hypothetical protein H0T73_00020, partial [Ardenticatenales bacterium]|nr:hypothetical protein [Ardenticatenales bacterium]